MLALPQLPIRQTRGNEPLLDHFCFHVVTFVEYLIILRKKALDKASIEEVNEER
jgi:hypothetical protein